MANRKKTVAVAACAKTMNDSWIQYLPGFVRRRLEGRPVLLEAMGNTGWLFADKIVRMGLGLLVGVWVARYLGPSRYGMLNYCASLVGLFTAVALLGLDGIVIRDLVRLPDQEREILGSTFFLRFWAGFVSYIFVVVTIFIIRPDDFMAHILVGIMGWTLVLSSIDSIDLWFQSKVQSKYVVLAKNTGFLISAMLRIALVVSKSPITWFAIANLIEVGLGAIGLLYVYRLKGGRINFWGLSFERAKTLLAGCLPLILAGIFHTINLRIDQVMLGQLADNHEVGIYAAAVRIAEIWFFIPTAIVSSVFPNIIKTKESDENEFYNRLQKLYNVLVFMGYVLAIVVSVVALPIVKLLFGKDYLAAAPMLAILMWSDIFISLAVARYVFLMAMNWTAILLYTVLAGTVVNILLNLLLIPRYGGMGAAIASFASYWVAAHLVCYFFKPLRRTAQMMTRALINPRFW